MEFASKHASKCDCFILCFALVSVDHRDAEGPADPAFLVRCREGRWAVPAVRHPAQRRRPYQARLHLQVLTYFAVLLFLSAIRWMTQHCEGSYDVDPYGIKNHLRFTQYVFVYMRTISGVRCKQHCQKLLRTSPGSSTTPVDACPHST